MERRAELPRPRLHTQQLTSAVTFFIWKGATFRVPVSTLQAQKRKGGWELIDISTKCRALLYSRMYYEGIREKTAWLREQELAGPLPNPPHAAVYLGTPTHVRIYAMDVAYIPPPNPNDNAKTFPQTDMLHAPHNGDSGNFLKSITNRDDAPKPQLATDLAQLT